MHERTRFCAGTIRVQAGTDRPDIGSRKSRLPLIYPRRPTGRRHALLRQTIERSCARLRRRTNLGIPQRQQVADDEFDAASRAIELWITKVRETT